MFVFPPLPDPPAPIKAFKVSPVGRRGDYFPGRNNWHRFGIRVSALKVTEKRLLKKRLSEMFQFTSKEEHIFGQKGIAKRYEKVMQKENAKM